jgi:hypothetical protein
MAAALALRSVLLILVFAVISTAYLALLADRIPGAYALFINFILIPLAMGFVSAFLLTGHIAVKLLALAVVPIAHVVYFGGDEGKPGLENVVAACEFAFLAIGLVIGSLLIRFRRAQSRHAH